MEILYAIIPVVIIGLICGAVLVVASKVMAVKENEKIPVIRECLPGANCGACGYAGCDGYAKALAEGETESTTLCIPGGSDVAKQLSEIMGVECGETVKKVAVVHCMGNCYYTENDVEYVGIKSCVAAKQIYGSKGKCSYGCLGFGDCQKVCQSNAISIKDGIAVVNKHLCIGCGLCEKACPNGVISLVADVKSPVVTCSNKDKGAETRKSCKKGCIGCKKCEKVCTKDAIKVVDNLAVIDYTKCSDCEDFGICARECTMGCISILDLCGLQSVKK